METNHLIKQQFGVQNNEDDVQNNYRLSNTGAGDVVVSQELRSNCGLVIDDGLYYGREFLRFIITRLNCLKTNLVTSDESY